MPRQTVDRQVTARTAERIFTQVRAAHGAVLLALPRAMVRLESGRSGRRGGGIARVLGMRQLLQATATSGPADAAVLALGAELDLAHAASMVALAVACPRWRRAAVVEAVVATGFAAAGIVLARRARCLPEPVVASGPIAAALRMRRRIAASCAARTVPASFLKAPSS